MVLYLTLLTFLYNYFQRPLFLFLIPLLVLLIIFLIKKEFIKIEREDERKKELRGWLNAVVFISRILIVVLLIVALAYPYMDSKKIVQGDPKVKILFDNSSSMLLYNTSFISSLHSSIAKELPVDYVTIGLGEDSSLGDSLIANIRKDDNLLLITDGNANKGMSLDDAVLYAKNINTTISAIDLSVRRFDSAISIIGPEKTTANAENKFTIQIEQNVFDKLGVGLSNLHVIISVDNTIIAEKDTHEGFSFTKSFEAGKHTIKAEIFDGNSLNSLHGPDFFKQNNVYYKTVKVVPKPKLLFLTSKESPLKKLFDPVYDVQIVNVDPSSVSAASAGLGVLSNSADLNKYSAIILNDIDAASLNNYVDALSGFSVDGNGLFFIGGKNSFDAGGYKGSRIEQILPSIVATAGKKKGDVNIALVIDISGSTGAAFGEGSTIDTEKALAIGVLKDLSLVNNVGVVAFNDQAYLVENISLMLSKSEKTIEDKILSLKDSGSTLIAQGLMLGHSQLQNLKGSKNIILISDGKTQERDSAIQAANFVASRGTRLYTVGVGADTDSEMMQNIAVIGAGNYFQPTTRQQLKLIFGETEIAGDRKVIPVNVFDKSHFITDDLDLKGNIYGFNVIIPKQSGKLLVATDTGDPILIIGRWGLGRVAALATDDGGLYAGELLKKESSRLYTKTMNWLIGDPERKNEYYLTVSDGFVGQNVEAVLKSTLRPAFKDANFIKYDKDLYKASIFANNTGVFSLGEAIYAVNYNTEYLHPAVNPKLEDFVHTTNGKMFNPNDVADIIAFIKASSKKEVHENKNIAWIFVLIALFIYLIEICYRRVVRNFNLKGLSVSFFNKINDSRLNLLSKKR